MSELYDYVPTTVGLSHMGMWLDEYWLVEDVLYAGPKYQVRAKIIQVLPRRDDSLRCRLLSSVHAKPSLPPWELHGDVLRSLYHRDFGQDPGPVRGGFRNAVKNLYWFELYGGTVTGRMKLSDPEPQYISYARREGRAYTAKLSDVLRQSRAINVNYAELDELLAVRHDPK